MLAAAIAGDLSALLLKDVPGVKLHRATLSHGINRHSHVEVRLPFYASSIDHINESLASASAVDTDGQRVVLYQLDASDEVARISNRGGNDSQLVVGASVPAVAGNATRVYGTPSFKYAYSFRQAARKMRREQLQYQVKPYVDRYVGNAFAAAPFDTFLSEMDRAVHTSPTDEFGYALLSINLAVPGSVVAAWLEAPGKERTPAYMDMSVALQAALKSLLPFYYFADVRNYETFEPAAVLVGYSAIPASTSVRLDGGQLHLDTSQQVYWDWMDASLRRAMLYSSTTEAKLRAMLPAVYQRLQSAGVKGAAAMFAPGDATVRRIRDAVAHRDDLLRSLLYTEAEIVDGALQAGLSMARFRAKQGADVKQATRSLAAFGATISDTFNKRVSSVYGGDAVRPLGTLLFATAAQALSGNYAEPSAVFRFVLLRPDAQFTPQDFLQGNEPAWDPDHPATSPVVAQQSIANL